MKKNELLPWVFWGLGASFFFIQYIARVAPSVMVPQLMQTFSVDAAELGSLSAFFYYAYVPMQLPVGLLVDSFGSRKLLVFSTLLATLGCFIFATTSSLLVAGIGRFILGFASSFAFICSIKLAAEWFPSSKLGLLTCITQSLGMLSAVIGEAPISFSVSKIGWRHSLLLITALFFILAICTFFIIRDKKKTADEKNTDDGFLKNFYLVIRNPISWTNALYAGALFAPIVAFSELWGVQFLSQVYHLPAEEAAFASSLVFIGWFVGGPLVGYLSDRIKRRRIIMTWSAIFSTGFLVLILFSSPSIPKFMLFGILFLFGMTNPGVAISYALAGEINPPKVTGTSVAFANMASVLIGTICQPIIGKLLDLNWNGLMVNGVRSYSSANFRHAMMILVACTVSAILFSRLTKETYCKNISL